MKRKADDQIDDQNGEVEEKKPARKKSKTSLADDEAKGRFRAGLFDKSVLGSYTQQYAESSPYKHGVIHSLVDDALLRRVRTEIQDNVSFTPKETDIYKIHQSGDLANLDGLDDAALARLPSLLALRDALYSDAFRSYVSSITGCGALSGRKTDMAINVYTPGCYLLCHDDVIGSRKVSYILYLTDPDQPWQPGWGGALRLFPVEEKTDKGGEVAKTPLADVAKVIPPAWNQLSFFAVQPGESFHDVEEVYRAGASDAVQDGKRIRMAISGWFHIPQIGEDGYVEGAEEKLAKNSGLMQLSGNPDQYDRPRARVATIDNPKVGPAEFDEADLDFLLKYMAPTYLTPDTLEQMAEHFDENSSITLPSLLASKFADKLRAFVSEQEAAVLPDKSSEIEEKTPWKVAVPPHKHRFLFQQPTAADEIRSSQEESPVTELLDIFLPSRQFRQWLQIATGCTVEGHDLLARRFRRGQDYTLATGHSGKSRLEVNLGFTPTQGWGEDEDDSKPSGAEESKSGDETDNKAEANGTNGASSSEAKVEKQEDAGQDDGDVGGHEVYMAGEDDGNDDAAIYRASGDDENILFFQPAAWNKMTIVLRDSGTLRFVKYVSRSAKGDRWDVSGVFEVEDTDKGGEEDEGDNGESSGPSVLNGPPLGESDEEEFQGFSDSEDSDSD